MVELERRLGHEVFLITGSEVNNDTHLIRNRFLKREINPFFDLIAWYQLSRSVKLLDADIVHTHESKAGILGRLNFIGGRRIRVHTVHMATFTEKRLQLSPSAFLSRILEHLASKKTDYLFFVGEELASIYRQKGIQGNISSSVVRSYVDIESFGKTKNRLSDKLEIFDELKLAPESKIILTIGLLEKRKNHAFIIQSLAKLLASSSELHLIITGSGRLKDKLVLLCKKLNVLHKVHFVGFRNDIPNLMNSADILVHASSQEGVPQVIIQAIASDVPVVALKACGTNELRHVTEVSGGERIFSEAVEGLLLDSGFPARRQKNPIDLRKWTRIEIDKLWESKLNEMESLVKSNSREKSGI
jgi:glycosyltransferase involved in cell wall biosynthesis